ncbi:TRAP transporter 4TM/12TM fusion protein [Natronocella acetinitrilica]|uniref:TRAP transporter 4TM/12TM fusion protein n=1 Tax=Natronocella acetinitrilica TaxID=414046 RepID=A0AAE3G927_9GAMM|nr:TRAP transporter fused permease subunit [Natronocella acetinitrilica]MCP1677264.1 TRAP transporter 4TM/12TM fusion protein [Natronocella acetinitrilica]
MKLGVRLLSAVTVAVALYHFYIALTGVPEPMVARPIHVSALLFLGFLLLPFRRPPETQDEGEIAEEFVPRWFDWGLAVLGIVSAVYIINDYDRISHRFVYLDPVEPMDWIVGLTTLALIIELARRVVGLILPLIVAAFAVFTLLGSYLPGVLRHQGTSAEKLFDHVFLTTTGVYGTLASLSLSIVFMFIAFGAFLQAAGGERLLSQIIVAMTRGRKGGPAKASVVASVLFGALTGSGAANVYATGAVTIPLMRRAGYKREFAAATEACASQLGQLLPPVMGAAAFIIAEFSRVSYGYVAMAALVPSFFYVLALYLAVHIESTKAGIGIYEPDDERTDIWLLLSRYWHLVLPLIILVVLLVLRYTPYFAATVATLAVIPISWLRKETRMGVRTVIRALTITMQRVVSIGIVLVCAGIGVAILEMTGVPYQVTGLLVNLSGGHMLPALLIVGAMTILLGFGMPVTGAFLIASLFGASALMEFGIDPFTAYMIIFLFALTANITPPVCVATFAAASIAQCNFMRAGMRGLRLGMPAYVIPIVIAYNPTLLNITEHGLLFGVQVLLSTTVAVVGLVVLMSDWLFHRLNMVQRALLLGSLLAIVMPSPLTDVLAASTVGAVILWQWLDAKRTGVSVGNSSS